MSSSSATTSPPTRKPSRTGPSGPGRASAGRPPPAMTACGVPWFTRYGVMALWRYALWQGPVLVGAVVAGVNRELGAVLGRVGRVVQAERAAVGLEHVLAAGVVRPQFVRDASAGPQGDLAAAPAGRLVVHALAVVHKLAVAEGPVLGGAAGAGPDLHLVPVGGAVARVVGAFAAVALDRGGRRGRRPRHGQVDGAHAAGQRGGHHHAALVGPAERVRDGVGEGRFAGEGARLAFLAAELAAIDRPVDVRLVGTGRHRGRDRDRVARRPADDAGGQNPGFA